MVYRDPARRDEEKDDDVREFERDVSDVEATFELDAGPDMGITMVTMMFEGDRYEPPDGGVHFVQNSYEMPQLCGGESRLHELLEQGVKREFVRLNDSFFPWHRLISVNIMRRIERKATVRWKVVHKPPIPPSRPERG